MFVNIAYLIAWIVVLYLAFRRRKPKPSKSSLVRDATLDPDAPTAFIIHGGQRERTEEPFEPKVIDRTLDPDWPSRLIFHGGHRESTREPSKPKLRIINRTLDPASPKTTFFLRIGPSDSWDNSEDDSP